MINISFEKKNQAGIVDSWVGLIELVFSEDGLQKKWLPFILFTHMEYWNGFEADISCVLIFV